MINRFSIASVVVLGLALAAGGCAQPQEYDAEPDPARDRQSKSIGLPRETDQSTPPEARPVPNPPGEMGRTDLLNAAKLQGMPAEVRNAFQRSFPNAGITSVDRLDAATGLTLYEINFLRNGRPMDIIYRPNGTPVPRTPLQDRSQ